VEESRRELLVDLLHKHAGNVSAVAREIGKTPRRGAAVQGGLL
jgi:hypothetical protein